MSVGGFWKWELERRLAVIRWAREDAARTKEDCRIRSVRELALERRRVQIAARELESSQMMFAGLEPGAFEARARRVAAEDADWVAATVAWDEEDRRRSLTRERVEAQRRADVQRWLDEDAWGVVNLDLPVDPDRPWLIH